MDREQFEAMFRRRGYTVFRYPQDEERPSLVVLRISRGNASIARAHDLRELQQVKEQGYLCDLVELDLAALSKGHHHMACGQCGLPVLRARLDLSAARTHFGEAWDGGKLGPQFDAIMKWEPITSYHYRAVSAGPDSLLLTNCPSCGRSLSESVREIDDTVEEPITIESLEDIWENQRIIPMIFKPTGETVYVTPKMAQFIDGWKEEEHGRSTNTDTYHQ